MTPPSNPIDQAVRRLRELAGKATPGFTLEPYDFDDCVILVRRDSDGKRLNDSYVVSEGDGPYIATLHPGVALAVADLLEAAENLISISGQYQVTVRGGSVEKSAKALATLLIQEEGE